MSTKFVPKGPIENQSTFFVNRLVLKGEQRISKRMSKLTNAIFAPLGLNDLDIYIFC